jgi:F0F1-type ATP synthase alpha subunit
MAVTAGLFDRVPVSAVGNAEEAVRAAVREHLTDLVEPILGGDALDDAQRQSIIAVCDAALAAFREERDADS